MGWLVVCLGSFAGVGIAGGSAAGLVRCWWVAGGLLVHCWWAGRGMLVAWLVGCWWVASGHT